MMTALGIVSLRFVGLGSEAGFEAGCCSGGFADRFQA